MLSYTDTLGILRWSYRSDQFIESAVSWALSRNISTKIYHAPKEIGQCNIDEPLAIYIPVNYCLEEIKIINKSIPIIIDIDAGADINHTPSLQWICDFARDREVATRTFSLYFDTPCDNVRYQVPYIHLPLELEYNTDRDVTIVDVHHWENNQSYLMILAELLSLEDLDLSYYYYCQGAPVIYTKILKCFTDNANAKCLRNIIPFRHKFSDYSELFTRLRCLVSNHRWVTDADVFNAYIAGAPLVGKNYVHPMAKAMIYLEPRLSEDLANLSRIHHERLPSIRTDIPTELYKTAFFTLWDNLWAWATTGVIDETLMYLTVFGWRN